MVVTREAASNETHLASFSAVAQAITTTTDGVTTSVVRATELVRVSAGPGAAARNVSNTTFDSDIPHYMLRDPQQHYTYLVMRCRLTA